MTTPEQIQALESFIRHVDLLRGYIGDDPEEWGELQVDLEQIHPEDADRALASLKESHLRVVAALAGPSGTGHFDNACPSCHHSAPDHEDGCPIFAALAQEAWA